MVLAPHGDLDLTQLARFTARVDALLAEGATVLVFDLADVSMLPSSAAGWLVRAASRLRDVGGRVLLAGPNRRAVTTLRVMGVLDLFAVHADVGSALAAAGA